MVSIPANDMAQTNQKRNLNGIDVIKFLCAIMVFLVHVAPFQFEVSSITDTINFVLLKCIFRIAVPFYFVCSGFFLFRKMPNYELNENIIKNYCFKILKLYGLWSILLFIGPADHLWYLSGTVIAVVLLSLCFHLRMKFGVICLLACVLYGIGLLGDSYRGLIAPIAEVSIIKTVRHLYARFFGPTRNGVFMGFIFVLIGAYFSQRKVHLKPKTAAIGYLFSTICLVIEGCVLNHLGFQVDFNMYIFLLPSVYFLFAFAYGVQLKDRAIYRHLRNIGVWIYFIHFAVARIVYLAREWLAQYFDTGILNPVFVFAFPATLLIAIALEWLSGKKKFKWVGWLIE